MVTSVIFVVVCALCLGGSRVLADRKVEPCQLSVETAGDLVWQRDAEDCSSAYLCLLGRTVTYACPDGFVIGAGTTDCVPIGSDMDDCTGARATYDNQLSLSETHMTPSCKPGVRSADEGNCAKYYDCVSMPDGNATLMSRECEYPLLFDTQTMKCESFKQVVCEVGQQVPKSHCEYEAYQCAGSHCVPCNVRFPSCTGLPDGMNSWVGREWSPSYVVCEEERVTFQGTCEGEKEQQVFHPELKQCVVPDDKLFG